MKSGVGAGRTSSPSTRPPPSPPARRPAPPSRTAGRCPARARCLAADALSREHPRQYSGALRRLDAWLGRPRARGRDPRRLPRRAPRPGESPGKRLGGGGHGLLPGPPRQRAEPGRGTHRPGPRRRPRPRAVAGVRGGRPGPRPRPPATGLGVAAAASSPDQLGHRARPSRRRDRGAPLSWPGCAGGERPPRGRRGRRRRDPDGEPDRFHRPAAAGPPPRSAESRARAARSVNLRRGLASPVSEQLRASRALEPPG